MGEPSSSLVVSYIATLVGKMKSDEAMQSNDNAKYKNSEIETNLQ